MSNFFKIFLIIMIMIIEGILFSFCTAIKPKKKDSLYKYISIHGGILIIVEVFFMGYLIFSLFL